ncbi:hypothetical protein H8356DRAFT_1315184 [Neocallimastix lanati (nom. inval.)]|uniref:Serine aminopeptidase S33 domain-containing protein n=1 Tax=Neocallimastix californiae TaxID=1754190 RepID=A0A1Y2C2R6_9FUNG|nr:hypothetical protein H8356DRAFT_1315184 [Neocallimastix sp. JGI-2020a]ORY41177.1 hypothetical protein LY90DRAFT_672114 [Neocallimastix californiae]|eukprot:ORY41177.1 hypothetical protein LY90DRAFT_672114 [Neocallimastix californiae]
MNHTVFYANNRKISLYIWENQNYFRPLAIIQIVHGFFDHASRYDEFAQFLVRHNFVVVAHDLNGHGYTTSIPSNHEVPNISSISSLSSPLSYSKTYKNSLVVNENQYSQIPNSQGYDLNENKKKSKTPVNIQNYTISSNDNSKEKNEIKKMPNSINTSSKFVGISTIPKASPVNQNELDITPDCQSSDLKIDNNNSNYANNKDNDNELPSYSSSFSHLGYEDGNMFENDVADIIAISSYCRERFLHLPLILLGVGYGSFLVQYFIEHNKYRLNNRNKNWEREDSSSYNNRSNYHHHNNHRYHQKKRHKHQHSSKHNEKKYNKEVYEGDDSSLIQRHCLTDPTINGFILCGTNYMKGLILRTNVVYSNLLYYIKGKNYRTNFLFPSIFQTYKLQTESELLSSDSDSDSDSDSTSDSDSYIESPRPGESSKERISVPIVTFSSSEIQKDKPLNQWFTRNYYELTKAQRDPLCNFSYSTNFYRSLLNATNKLYKKKSGKAINTKIPILIVVGDHDPLGNYSKGPVKLYNFYKDYKVNNVKLFIYENARHSVLFENNKVEIYHDILKWTNDNILTGY